MKQKIFTITILTSIFLTLNNPSNAGDQLTGDLLIQNTTIISPERSDILKNAHILIEDGKITDIQVSEIATRSGTKIVDGSGLYLIPGLMDSHIHTLVTPGLGFHGGERSNTFPEMAALYDRQFTRSLLYHGVTQVLDPAATPQVIAQHKNKRFTPDIFHCGAAPLSNGYPTMFMDEDAINQSLPYRVYEKPTISTASTDPINFSQHSPEAVVKRMKADRAICLKLFFEDGWDMRSDWPMLSSDSLHRLITSARKNNLKVVGHANALDMQQLAVDAGIDVIGHGLWNWNQYSKQPGVPDAIAQHLDNVIDNKISYQPTLRVMDSMQEMYIPSKLENPALKKVVPASLLEWYKTEVAQKFKRELAEEDFDGLPDPKIVESINHPISRSERTVRYLADKDYDLLLASDHPATPGHANHPGLSTYQEMRHMATLGVSLKQILASATINNAEAFGLESRYGTVEPGKIANLLLLNANPLERIDAYNQIEHIILRGKTIDRELLSAETLHE